MKTKATHRGNCQVCGRQHHVTGAVLATHGYTVRCGYFQDTCPGSNKKPMQVERAITDSTIMDLGQYAFGCDRHTIDLKSGAVRPFHIKIGEKYNCGTYKFEPVIIAWADGTPDQQAKGLKLAIAISESDARHARAHAASLKKVVNELHGTALAPIDEPILARAPAPAAVVDVKGAKVHGAFGSKIARKRELEKLSRAYRHEAAKIRNIFLAIPYDQRTPAQDEVYNTPHDLHQWRAKHGTATLKEFPQAADIVATIEELAKAREAVKAAP